MTPLYREEDIENLLADAFKHRYHRKDVVLTGFLLARPEDPMTKDHILPALPYWHHRADNVTDYFCAGYTPRNAADEKLPPLVTIDDVVWAFSLEAFLEIEEKLERRTGERTFGDPCLVLLNAYFDGKEAHLDYDRFIWINFREAINDKAVMEPTQLSMAVFEFAKTMNEDNSDPVWTVSDSLGKRVLKKGLKEAFLAWLPTWLVPSTKEAWHYAVHEAK